jgi:hypothetical protein
MGQKLMADSGEKQEEKKTSNQISARKRAEWEEHADQLGSGKTTIKQIPASC